MTKEQCDFLAETCKAYGIEHDIRERYSGRGMYGNTTYAIVVPDWSTLLCAVVEYTKGLSEDGLNEIPEFDYSRGLASDSMGKNSIVIY